MALTRSPTETWTKWGRYSYALRKEIFTKPGRRAGDLRSTDTRETNQARRKSSKLGSADLQMWWCSSWTECSSIWTARSWSRTTLNSSLIRKFTWTCSLTKTKSDQILIWRNLRWWKSSWRSWKTNTIPMCKETLFRSWKIAKPLLNPTRNKKFRELVLETQSRKR